MTAGDGDAEEQALEARAESGDVGAMRALAFGLRDRDRPKALLWWRRAAETGDSRSMYNLGLALRDDSPEEASRWLRNAADLGDRMAMALLAETLDGVDQQEAERWWRRAAEAHLAGPEPEPGEVISIYNLGCTFRDSDPGLACRLFEIAAEAAERTGDDETARDASLNLYGLLGNSDHDQALVHLTKAAELGDAPAMARLGALADDHGDETTARRWFELAIAAGDGWSANQLAAMIYETDPVEARRLCELAAERGFTPAKRALGKLLFKENRPAAWRWIEEAAQEGDGWAIGMLAHRYIRRHPTSQSRRSKRHAELMDLLRRGSEESDPYSMYNYGHRLAAEGDDEQAARWLAKAAAADIEPARLTLKAMGYDEQLQPVAFRMTPRHWARFLLSLLCHNYGWKPRADDPLAGTGTDAPDQQRI